MAPASIGDFRIELDEPRSVREILLAALALYRRYPLLFASLAGAVVAPYELALLTSTGYGPLSIEGAGISWLDLLLRTALVDPLVSALHVHAVLQAGAGRRPQLRAVALRGFRALPLVGAAALLSGVATFLGFALLVIPGIVLALRWAVVSQVAALERTAPAAAMDSSRQLTAGHYWHVLRLLLIGAALAVAVTRAARAIPLGSSSGVISVAVGIAVETILASFAALTLALLYFDLRARAQVPASAELAL